MRRPTSSLTQQADLVKQGARLVVEFCETSVKY
jgi:hypothetical protein